MRRRGSSAIEYKWGAAKIGVAAADALAAMSSAESVMMPARSIFGLTLLGLAAFFW